MRDVPQVIAYNRALQRYNKPRGTLGLLINAPVQRNELSFVCARRLYVT
jgi:hypothetical protein